MPGQQRTCIATVELSENILQNLGNDLMADRVDKSRHLLCHIEGEGEVVPPVSRVQFVKFERLRVEVVDERAERDAVVPAR